MDRHEDQFLIGSFLLSTVHPKRVEYIWEGRMAAGMLTMIDGDPGTGKTTMAMDIAARITTGEPMPGEEARRPPKGVVLLSAEDSLEQTIRPRMEAAGADLQKVGIVIKRKEGEQAYINPVIPDDIGGIARQIEALDAGLIMIDPIMSYLSGELDANNDQNVRAALAPLVSMAEDKGAAILMLRHLNKSIGSSPMYRGGGSIGLIGAARFALVAARDPDDPTGVTRILAPNKINVGKEPPAIRYTLESVEDKDVAVVAWGEEYEVSAATLLMAAKSDADQARLRDCIDWLRQEMEGDPVNQPTQKDTKSRATRDGFTWDEVKTAMGMLDIGTWRQDATQDMVLTYRERVKKPDPLEDFSVE